MKAISTWLTALLGLQSVLILAVFWQSSVANKGPEKQNLFDFSSTEVTKLVLDNGQGENVELYRNGGEWQVELEGKSLPVQDQKLQSMMDKFQDLSVRWPVADTDSSQKRMKVSRSEYNKQVKFFNNDHVLAHAYVGSSPGFRKVHIRKEGDDNVYAVPVNQTDIITKADDWMDKTLLSISDIDQVSHTNFQLDRNSDEWAFKPLSDSINEPEKWTLEQKKAQDYIGKFSNFRVLMVANTEEIKDVSFAGEDKLPVEDAKEASLVTVKVNKDDQSFTYKFASKENNYFVTRDDIEAVFKIAKYQFDGFVLPKIEEWMKTEIIDHQIEESEESNVQKEDQDNLEEMPKIGNDG